MSPILSDIILQEHRQYLIIPFEIIFYWGRLLKEFVIYDPVNILWISFSKFFIRFKIIEWKNSYMFWYIISMIYAHLHVAL